MLATLDIFQYNITGEHMKKQRKRFWDIRAKPFVVCMPNGIGEVWWYYKGQIYHQKNNPYDKSLSSIALCGVGSTLLSYLLIKPLNAFGQDLLADNTLLKTGFVILIFVFHFTVRLISQKHITAYTLKNSEVSAIPEHVNWKKEIRTTIAAILLYYTLCWGIFIILLIISWRNNELGSFLACFVGLGATGLFGFTSLHRRLHYQSEQMNNLRNNSRRERSKKTQQN